MHPRSSRCGRVIQRDASRSPNADVVDVVRAVDENRDRAVLKLVNVGWATVRHLLLFVILPEFFFDALPRYETGVVEIRDSKAIPFRCDMPVSLRQRWRNGIVLRGSKLLGFKTRNVRGSKLVAFWSLPKVRFSATLQKPANLLVKSGAPGAIRTPDLVLRRHTLYPAELRARRG